MNLATQRSPPGFSRLNETREVIVCRSRIEFAFVDFSSDTWEYNEANKCFYFKYYLKFTCSVNENLITKQKT